MTSNLTQKNKALEQLRQAIVICKDAGITIGVGPMYNAESKWCIFISDDDIEFDGKKFEALDE